MLFDSHSHMEDNRFDEDRDTLLRKIHQDGVLGIINVGADLPTSIKSIRLAQQYDFIYASVGFHPHDVSTLDEDMLSEIEKLSYEKKVVAIGEIGLDYHYENSQRETQLYWFRRQIALAAKRNLPIIVHDRDAHKDCLDAVKEEGYFKGVFHCFSGSREMARELLDLGFYLSLAGPVTFKNAAKTVEVAKYVPLDRLLIETDSPYLAPEPKRGERNHSGNVFYVAEKIAKIKGLSVDTIAKSTAENTKRLFQIEN